MVCSPSGETGFRITLLRCCRTAYVPPPRGLGGSELFSISELSAALKQAKERYLVFYRTAEPLRVKHDTEVVELIRYDVEPTGPARGIEGGTYNVHNKECILLSIFYK